MVLQSFVSRFKTLRVKLSREAYQNSGIGIFSSERIPFADRTSPTFVQNLVELLVQRVEKLQKSGKSFANGIHIYELGAGMGMLAKRILDLLKKTHPHIYHQVTLHVSDLSKPMITRLKSSNIFKNHQTHVAFEVIDATKPKFTHRPLLVYFTNLIDTIPSHRHIQISNGKIFELQVQTSLKKDAQVIDTTVFPPRILEKKELAKLLSAEKINRRLTLAPQILKVLQENIQYVPIDDVTNMGEQEQADLKNLAEFRQGGRPAPFNYSFTARKVIQKIVRQLAKGGFLFFSDTGITSTDFEQDLVIKYGLVVAFPVDFPSFMQLAQKLGTAYLTANAQGHPQEMLIDTLPKDKKISARFKQPSSAVVQAEVTTFLENVRLILSKSPASKRQKLTRINDLYASLTPESKINYQVLNDLPFFLLQANFYKQASFYANLLFKNYHHTAGVYYYIVKGVTEQHSGNYKKAESLFKQTINNQEGFLAFGYLGGLYWKQKRYPVYIKTIKEYLKYTRKNDYLKCMFFIALAEEKLRRRKATKEILAQLIALGQKLKYLPLPEQEFLKQAKKYQKGDKPLS